MKLWEVVTGEWSRPVIAGPGERLGPEHLNDDGERYDAEDLRIWEEINTDVETVISHRSGQTTATVPDRL